MKKIKVLDLFSGIGGFSLGLERAGMETVAFCEIDEKCRQVLSKHWPDVPQYTDIRELKGSSFNDSINVVCGGFPCQPYSTAGKQKGKEDDRDLWPEMFRVIKEVAPTWVIGENVANFTNMAFTRTKVDLESVGYIVQPFIIPACGVGAPHERKRVWIIAYTNSENVEGLLSKGCVVQKLSKKAFPELRGKSIRSRFEQLRIACIGRGGDGLSSGVDRLKQLGNAVVPQIPEIIGRAILEFEASKSRHNQ